MLLKNVFFEFPAIKIYHFKMSSTYLNFLDLQFNLHLNYLINLNQNQIMILKWVMIDY